jgi:serine O-acetyltransferase
MPPTPRHLTLAASSTFPAPLAHPAAARDSLWRKLLEEAEAAFEAEPNLRALLRQTVLDRDSFEEAVAYRVASRFSSEFVPVGQIVAAFTAALKADPDIGLAFRADINAVIDRDPACGRFIEPFLYFKGFHALQIHRLAHHLWKRGKKDFALYLQSRSSDLFQTDIHPAARIGQGVFLDHATGFVVGSTAVIDDDVSILQNVTLGGTGKESGDRHPKVRRGVLLGAGAKILGNIEVGENARIAAGSVVLHPVPAHTTVAGVPAKVVARHHDEPYRDMDQVLKDLSYAAFSYAI